MSGPFLGTLFRTIKYFRMLFECLHSQEYLKIFIWRSHLHEQKESSEGTILRMEF